MAPPLWEDVPDNILVRVIAYLPCRADRVHMSCVNRHWHRAVRGQDRPPQLPPLPSLPPQLPWLIFPSTETPSFFSAIECRTHQLPLPHDVRVARPCGSWDGGWLVLTLDSSHRHALYNLNSGEFIDLPAGLDIPTGLDQPELRNIPVVVRAATLSSSPASSQLPCMIGAIVLVKARWSPAFWCEGRESWISLGRMRRRRRPQDVIYYMGGFYFITNREEVVVYWPGRDETGELLMRRFAYDMQRREDYEDDVGFVEGHGSMKRYLVESRGHLHMVVRYAYSDGGTEVLRVFRFHVFPGTTHGQQERPRATWLGLDGLDGRMLFLGRGCSRSVEVAQFDGFEDSMIYFLDEGFIREPTVDDRRWYSFTDMGRHSMDEMATEAWPPVNHRPARSDNAPPTWWLH